MKSFWRILPLLGLVGCFSGSTGTPRPRPQCEACLADGDPCRFSLECQPGSICNLGTDPFFEPEANAFQCHRVYCDSDADCLGGKTCTLEKVCRNLPCQSNAECDDGFACIGGVCDLGYAPENVARCTVPTFTAVLAIGQRRPLHAVTTDVREREYHDVPLVWRTNDTSIVRVEAGEAIATAPGEAVVTAAAEGPVDCNGRIRIVVVEPSDEIDVVVVDHLGEPVSGAMVSTASVSAVTNASGMAVLPALDTFVTAALGDRRSTVPMTGDTIVTLPPPVVEPAVATVRGSVSIPRTADLRVGVVLPALPNDLRSLGLGLDVCSGTTVSVPDLSGPFTLLGVEVFELGTDILSDDSDDTKTRCGPHSPPPGTAGCFTVRSRPDTNTLWTIAAPLRLSQALGPLNDGLTCDGTFGALIEAHRDWYASTLAGTYALAERTDADEAVLAPRAQTGLHGLVRFAHDEVDGVLVLPAAVMPDRGIVPLGLGGDVATFTNRDRRAPFGPFSVDFERDEAPFSSAAPIAGTETVIAAIAIDDPGRLRDIGRRLAGRVLRVDRFGERHEIGAAPPIPRLDGTGLEAYDAVRLDIVRGDEIWRIDAGVEEGGFRLPPGAGAAIDAADERVLSAVSLDVDPKRLNRLEDPLRFDPLVLHVEAFGRAIE